MSGTDSGPGRREVAYRLFAAEFDDASLSYSESDEERAPNYVVTPTGLRVNRLFAVGVLTEVESINEDTLRGRIVDPSGAFVTYAGQYQPPAQAFLDQTTPPAFVAITGKARTFEPEDSDRVFTSVRPESISQVDADTRDRWVVSAAESTLQRIAVCAAAINSPLRGDELQAALAEAGVDASLAQGIPRALDHYEPTTAYLEGLRQLAIDALELVADERDEVRALELAPDEGGETELGRLQSVDLDLSGAETVAAESSTDAATQPTASTRSDDAKTTPEDTEKPIDATAVDTETAEPTGGTAEPAGDTAESDTAESNAEADDDEPEPVDTTTAAGSSPETASGADETANGAGETTISETDTEETAEDVTAGDETGMYQLDEDEREQLESEFDTGFSSGNEVDPAGEADIDVPDVDELAEKAESEASADEPTAPTAETESPTDDGETLGEFDDGLDDFEDDIEPTADTAEGETASKPDEAGTDTPDSDSDDTVSPVATDIDLEETVVGTMSELDDGDGVDRQRLVTEVVDTYGVEETAVEEAIADALMGGRCYEPGDNRLKAI